METPRTDATAMPRHAPEDIPVVYGSARGLFIMPCMETPATASPVPAKMAKSTRGALYCQMYVL